MRLAPTPLMFQGRIAFLRWVVLCSFIVVLGGYYRIQVLRQEHYQELGEKYRIKKRRIKATRGLIYDRNQVLITQNMPTYDLVLLRDEMEEPWSTFKTKIATFLNVSEEELQERYRSSSQLLSQPVTLAENIDFSKSMSIRRNQLRYPGLAIEISERRYYPQTDLFAHVLGYVGEVSQNSLKQNANLRLGDIVGKSGMELIYNDDLTGVDGERTIMIDHRGVYRSQRITKQPQPGDDLYLTIDIELQKLAYDALKDRRGSVVMMDVNSGEVLAYVSSPSFDLNLFANGISRKKLNELLRSPEKPFLNRPIQGAYAPGSVFKMVTALAALKHNKINPATTHYCSGAIEHYGRRRHCHRRGGHGHVNLEKAIKTSCNVYFYKLAMDMDVDHIAQTAQQLGLGGRTQIDTVGEKSGLVPTRAWKKRRTGHIWYPGDTLSVAIGQGDLQVTPVQLLVLMAALATNGEVPTPHILQRINRNDQFIHNDPAAKALQGFPEEHFHIIKNAMWAVVNASHGTGSKAKVNDFDVCGKTGTAQLITFTKESQHKKDIFKNAWFAGFAPRDNPKVAVVVLVEQAGSGGANAAPIAQMLFKRYKQKLSEVDPS